MGKYLFDQYTFLHFSVGAVIYFWGVTLFQWIVIHVLFEIFENTVMGMALINNNFKIWPGGKPFRDSFTNIVGDNIGAILGWGAAYYIDTIGSKLGYYEKHISN